MGEEMWDPLVHITTTLQLNVEHREISFEGILCAVQGKLVGGMLPHEKNSIHSHIANALSEDHSLTLAQPVSELPSPVS